MFSFFSEPSNLGSGWTKAKHVASSGMPACAFASGGSVTRAIGDSEPMCGDAASVGGRCWCTVGGPTIV